MSSGTYIRKSLGWFNPNISAMQDGVSFFMYAKKNLAAAGAKVEKGLNCLGAGYSSRTTTATAAMAAALEAEIMEAAQEGASGEDPWLKGGNAAMAFA